MTTQKNFGQKILSPGGDFVPKKLLTKNGLLSLYFPNAAINFSNCWYENYPYGFLWENHSVYAGKILVRTLGGIFNPKNVNPLRWCFLKVVGFCWKFALCVIWWCWIHFWCYFGHFLLILFYYLSIIIIFKDFRLAASVFMFFIYLAAAKRP